MDVLLVDGLLNNFPGAERDVSGGVEIGRSLGEGSVDAFPSLDFR